MSWGMVFELKHTSILLVISYAYMYCASVFYNQNIDTLLVTDYYPYVHRLNINAITQGD